MSRGGAWTPLGERNFRLLATARTIDYLGNGVAPIALAFAVLDLTGSTTDLGIVVGARSIANVALLLFGGVLADRLPRPLVLQGCALLAAASQAVAAASVLGGFDSVPLLALLGIVNGAGAAGSHPAASALVPQTVPSHLLRQANALARMGVATAMIVGSSVGGILVAGIGPGWGLAVDGATFAAAALCFARLRVPAAPSRAPTAKPLRQLRDGWTEFTARSWVWVVVLQFLVVNAVVAASVQVLGPAVADHTIGRTTWGSVLAAETTGTLLGAVLAAHWQPRRALLFGVALGMAELLPILALAHLPQAAVLMAAMFLSGLAIEQFSVAWEVSLQQHIPPDTLARVYSYDALGSFVAIPLGQLTVGPLAQALGAPLTLDVAAGAIAVATVASLAVPSVRRLTAPPREPAVAPTPT